MAAVLRLGAVAVLILGTLACAARPPIAPPPVAPPPVVEPRAPEPPPQPPAVEPPPPEPMPRLECVEVRGLGRTADGFIQVGSALADEAGQFALQWICRGEDWRLRLQRCSAGCGPTDESALLWEDVAELSLGPLSRDEVLVFGAGACSLRGAGPEVTIVARAPRSSLEKLPLVARAWRAVLKPPFAFRSISPSGVECLNPDYGL